MGYVSALFALRSSSVFRLAGSRYGMGATRSVVTVAGMLSGTWSGMPHHQLMTLVVAHVCTTQ
jgi:uncharacterized protein YcfJ